MPSDQKILSAALTVQSELETLLGASAPQVAPELAQLITQVETGQADSFDLEMLLAGYDATRDRMAALLNQSQPSQESIRYHPLAGNQQITTAQKYTCPQCGYLWYRRDAGQAIQTCPDDKCSNYNGPLTPAQIP